MRWARSAIFLIVLPALYLLYVQIALARQPVLVAVHVTPPSVRDAFKFVVVMSLIAPPLGFYDLWQALVRALPDLFYSADAKERIQSHYPNASMPDTAQQLRGSSVGFSFRRPCFF